MNGQKESFKARLVARGFQENTKPQSDSPTAMRESFKLFLAITANSSFQMRAIDIRAAFLQAEPLKREVIIQPPKDLSKEGKIWRLLKPIYGLDDASRRFWLTVKRIIKEECMSNLTGDEAFYDEREGEYLIGTFLTHVYDFHTCK